MFADGDSEEARVFNCTQRWVPACACPPSAQLVGALHVPVRCSALVLRGARCFTSAPSRFLAPAAALALPCPPLPPSTSALRMAHSSRPLQVPPKHARVLYRSGGHAGSAGAAGKCGTLVETCHHTACRKQLWLTGPERCFPMPDCSLSSWAHCLPPCMLRLTRQPPATCHRCKQYPVVAAAAGTAWTLARVAYTLGAPALLLLPLKCCCCRCCC